MKTHAQTPCTTSSRTPALPIANVLAQQAQYRQAMRRAGVQPRLAAGAGAGAEPWEREADAAAERVMHRPAPEAELTAELEQSGTQPLGLSANAPQAKRVQREGEVNACTTSDNLDTAQLWQGIDGFLGEGLYELGYRAEPGKASEWLRLVYCDGVSIDINLTDIHLGPGSVDAQQGILSAAFGKGMRVFPSELNARTTPRLAKEKQRALEAMRDEVSFIEQAALISFGVVSGLLPLAPSTVSTLPQGRLGGGAKGKSTLAQTPAGQTPPVTQGTRGKNLAKIGDDFGKFGKLVANPRIKVNWANTTAHGRKRMAQRGVTQSMVDSWVQNGKALYQKPNGTYLYIAKDGAAVLTKKGELVTIYKSSEFKKYIADIAEKLF